MTVRRSLALAAAMALPSIAVSQEQHAHVHGQAFVDVAVEGGAIEIRLRATAHDLVGFERKPANADEEAQLLAARKTALDHARLWQFSIAAQCVAEGPVLEAPGAAAEHDHDHDHGHDDHAGHSDWAVRYRFRCASPASLRSIDTGLFAAFPSLQSATVQLLDANGAREATLTPGAARLSLAP
jgi:hypothetical protein